MMKITEDLRKTIQKAINSMGSISEFSRITNVSIETLSRFLSQKTRSVSRETWNKIYPVIQGHLTESEKNETEKMEKPRITTHRTEGKISSKMYHGMEFLTSDEKILLDAFAALPPRVQTQKLLEIVDLARQQLGNDQ